MDFIYSHLTSNGKALITTMGDGVMEKNDDNPNNAFDIVERKFKDKIVKVSRTSCRIVNWNTFEKELSNAKLSIIEKFNTPQISGFNNSMVVICEIKNKVDRVEEL